MAAPCQALVSEKLPHFFCHVVSFIKYHIQGKHHVKRVINLLKKSPSAIKLTWQTRHKAVAKLNVLADISKSYSVKGSCLNRKEKAKRNRVLTHPPSLLPILH